jgi:hypothetical protein
VEELEGGAKAEWYTKDGGYIRGLKPDGELGNPVFEAGLVQVCCGTTQRFCYET